MIIKRLYKITKDYTTTKPYGKEDGEYLNLISGFQQARDCQTLQQEKQAVQRKVK